MDEAISRRIRESQIAIANTLTGNTTRSGYNTTGPSGGAAEEEATNPQIEVAERPVMANDDLMCEKAHGSSEFPVQPNKLRCDPLACIYGACAWHRR